MNPITAEPVLPDAALATFAAALRETIARTYPQADAANVAFEAPRRPEFGDFATNAAFGLARIAKRSPQDIAGTLVRGVREVEPRLSELFTAIEPAAGFINLRLAPAVWQSVVAHVLREGRRFGEGPKKDTRISLEFGSANPTGPLVVVQGRTCSIGDTIANAMRYCGYDVYVEWIINDAGGQLDTLGRSLYARYRQIFEPDFPFPEDGYPGEYLIPFAQELAKVDQRRWIGEPEEAWLGYFAKFARDRLVDQQMHTVERFGVHYDLWQSEKELHDTGRIKAGLQRLTELGHTYEQDGALFFRATDYGDDKDRVLVRRDGRPTYFSNDVTYHYEKLRRADKVVDILGPDHHGYIGRLKGLAEALGYSRDNLEVLIAQQITLMRGNELVSMSKRAGNIVTLDDIIDEAGVDAARFFFIMLSPESPLTFDLALAKEQSNENPVYYVQYGHARISSVFKNADPSDLAAAREGRSLSRLTSPAEVALARRLAEMPRIVQNVAEHLAPHRLTKYARDIASDFHQFYHESRILVEDRDTRLARLGLCIATQTVLARALAIMGVSAPESM
ncbi:MAG TPA: arginine--tRNA ligase [Candidatus Baltobacteraceae bacterium]|jgi:arginyl-tRNA synthetase|nr:arginine--tRNA ligase [Candidatus Baltobacteraceae bacterium]